MRGGLNEADRHDRADVVGRKSIETRSGSHQGTGQLADYYPLIFKAVIRLEPNTTETRGKIYDRARTAMLLQLRSVIPGLANQKLAASSWLSRKQSKRLKRKASTICAPRRSPRYPIDLPSRSRISPTCAR